MVKKIIHIIMALLLFVFTLGINVNMHYCAGKMVNVSLSSEHLTCCTDGQINCCDIITERFELDKYNFPVRLNFQPEDITENALPLIEKIQNFSPVQTLVSEYLNGGNAPPGPYEVKTVLARLQSYLL